MHKLIIAAILLGSFLVMLPWMFFASVSFMGTWIDKYISYIEWVESKVM